MWVLTLAGRDRDGDAFGTFLLDSTIGGAGAYIDDDGLDASGEYPVPRPAMANVESNEASGPYLPVSETVTRHWRAGSDARRHGVGTRHRTV